MALNKEPKSPSITTLTHPLSSIASKRLYFFGLEQVLEMEERRWSKTIAEI